MEQSELLAQAASRFGSALKAKLSGLGAVGSPEDQVRAPLETLLGDLAAILHFRPGQVVPVGETVLAAMRTRPDYAVTAGGALIGFMELKAPGKGADPRRFRDEHDRAQWLKLRALPNLIYTDGNAFSLWRGGELQGGIVRMNGDVETAGAALAAPPALLILMADFLRWEPVPPTGPRALAYVSAGLCRLLRDEVAEGLQMGTPALTGLAEDWRRLLFPDATDEEFADGYAQAVTFGLLVARAQGIPLAPGLDRVARALGRGTVIGGALHVLTDDADSQDALKTSLGTLVRVLDAVDWAVIGKGDPDAWLYFYEHFLEAYDNALRRQTGSYYTPPEVVRAMVRLVDDALRDPALFHLPGGLAAPDVTLADPAVGTGTFLLGVLRRIGNATLADAGPGAVPGAIRDALRRVIGFELQFGPFAVAQLRLTAEVADMMGVAGAVPADVRLRLYVTDTLGNPDEEHEYIPQILRPLAESRRQANAVKRQEPVTVVLGNPPYKEKALGRGGWIEAGSPNTPAPLARWMPPAAWRAGAHTKHLRNLYVYFWRWAAWKVFGDDPAAPGRGGVVCFITVAGFLNGPGFQAMRADLRGSANEVWVVDCSPEGHQPAVNSRIFQGVQQPVCIVLAARTAAASPSGRAARVRFLALPEGHRTGKFEALDGLALDGADWVDCPADPRAPFLPASAGGWAAYPGLEAFFGYNGSGIKPGRSWVIAPDRESLETRWKRLIAEKNAEEKERLFHPELRGGQLAGRHVNRIVRQHLGRIQTPEMAIARSDASPPKYVRYGFRSFDRQWLIADARVINDPRPELWHAYSPRQIYATALTGYAPTGGPAVTFSALIPDQDHYKGSFAGRAFPLWADAAATQPNIQPGLLALLTAVHGAPVPPGDVMAYLAAVAAHPAYTARFAADLVQPGLRIPLTADPTLWTEATALGREVVWLHSFGERFADTAAGRPAGPPRLPAGARPTIPAAGAIPGGADAMPDALRYDEAAGRLHVGAGYVDGVSPAVWRYEVSGKQVLAQWFSYRGRDRRRPLIGDRRPPSALGTIQPPGWLAEYTQELLNVLHVLGRLVLLEPRQADLLARIAAGPLLTRQAVQDAAAATPSPVRRVSRAEAGRQGSLL